MIDVHAHLNSKEFDLDREIVVQEAIKNGVKLIIDNAESFEENEKSLLISSKFKNVKTAMGFDPANLDKTKAQRVREQIEEKVDKIVAIGEIGLDFWKVKEQKERQIEIFESFLELAKEFSLPVIVHSRSAGRKTIELLEKNHIENAVLHAFDGNFESAKKGVELGYFFSVPPSIVRSTQKQALVEKLPIECLLLESDSPVLGPVVGERNTPKNILISAQEIARIKEIDIEQVKKETSLNTKKVLNIRLITKC